MIKLISISKEGATSQHTPETSIETPCSGTLGHESSLKIAIAENPGYKELAETLLAAFPSEDDLKKIVAASNNIQYYFLQQLTKPLGYFRSVEFGRVAELTVRYTPKTHPVLIARQMLMLAVVILHIDCASLNTIRGLSEPPQVTMKRLANTAIDLVATNNKMTDTVEGIECIMLQSTYEEGNGNLRQSWMAWRHAISISQVMGLHRQSPPPLKSVQTNEALDAHFIRYQLLYVDRFLSLMVGLPQAVSETPKVSEYTLRFGEPMDELTYIHATVASKILRRNERGPNSGDVVYTQEIDAEMQRGSEKLPSRWWLPPNLAGAENEIQIFWEVTRLRSQVYHYNLLNQLHLPYMLHLTSGPKSPRHDYSRMACINASRDLLSRYNMCRGFNTSASSCRMVDSFALWAAMALLFAHIDGHQSASRAENVLGHQRLCDRAMVVQALEHVELLKHTNDYEFKMKCTAFLEKMLTLEEDVSRGLRLNIVIGTDDANSANILRIDIPYVGIITITEDNEKEHRGATVSASESITHSEIEFSGYAAPHGEARGLAVPVFEAVDTRQLFPGAAQNINGSVSAQSFFPDLATGSNQWMYQGIDLTYFDSLMREAN